MTDYLISDILFHKESRATADITIKNLEIVDNDAICDTEIILKQPGEEDFIMTGEGVSLTGSGGGGGGGVLLYEESLEYSTTSTSTVDVKTISFTDPNFVPYDGAHRYALYIYAPQVENGKFSGSLTCYNSPPISLQNNSYTVVMYAKVNDANMVRTYTSSPRGIGGSTMTIDQDGAITIKIVARYDYATCGTINDTFTIQVYKEPLAHDFFTIGAD